MGVGFPELVQQKDVSLSEAELKIAFKQIDSNGVGEITKQQFLDQFRKRYVCTSIVSMTDGISLKDCKAIRKLDCNEVVEVLEEPSKDEESGLMRVKTRAERDGKEGYVTLSGNQGTVYLEAYSPYRAIEMCVEQALQELGVATSEAAKHLDRKTNELKSVAAGPLATTKAELVKLKSRVAKVRQGQVQLKKQVVQAQQKVRQTK